jgi:ATP-dependent helicase/nuclease subunit B
VWHTPEVLTWDAWLVRQWRVAVAAGNAGAARQLLARSQQRALWQSVLHDLPAAATDPAAIGAHASALIRSATRATQSLLLLARQAMTEEEALLAAAITEVRRRCAAHGWLILELEPPGELGFLAHTTAPLILGQVQPTALQARCQQLYWSGRALMPALAEVLPAEPLLRRAQHLAAEIEACAQWCRVQLAAAPQRRLLVISACTDPSLRSQGAMLWRAIAEEEVASAPVQSSWLAVEGGESLHHQRLVADALIALEATADPVDTQQLLRLLRSPYLQFGTNAEQAALQEWFGTLGLARWQRAALREALSAVSGAMPAAARLLAWLSRCDALLPLRLQEVTTQWASRFSQCLQAAGFGVAAALDSRDLQRLTRWSELLDEFAALQSVLPALGVEAARAQLLQLARQAVHQAATGDAAITLAAVGHDPLVRYDGIWVLGLTENRWPEAPRPDPYVALSEQRRAQWPEAGVTQRRAQARWLLDRWRRSTSQLVLSHACLEGDLHHRPTALLPLAAEAWQLLEPESRATRESRAQPAVDAQLRPFTPEERARPLRSGVERLRIQQECAFRSQLQWRLGAEPPGRFTDGIPPRLRGTLLHSLLQGLWSELGDQRRLLALRPDEQLALAERHWQAAVQANRAAGAGWLDHAVLERERRRSLRLVSRLLDLDRDRADFSVQSCERDLRWSCAGASMRLRIDRIDQTADGQRVLIDYKSGEAGSIDLADGVPRPLQLAVYVTALAAAGERIDAAALLSLKSDDIGYAGVAATGNLLPGRVRSVDDWADVTRQWRTALEQLLLEHLQGPAPLASDTAVCRNCHLEALCRRSLDADDDRDSTAMTEADA